ncbi:hypothetical protein CFC21_082152 [Triticum aestivum]|uniref:Ubiquitin-like protease family profile domain-containing protein n=1 Tax=Triticum aestivum TaxID=4565 RepID=A0A9R1L4Z8_WHEAT|nr:hypothetical protein CFC21_082152 [Triticum aestivum]
MMCTPYLVGKTMEWMFLGFLVLKEKKQPKKYQLVLLARKMYLYWEKVQPITGPKYDPLALLSPLMRNWTEDMAVRRDKYDYEYGRGVGMIDDNITEEYRLKKIAEEEAQKTKKASSKKSNDTGTREERSTSEASSQKPTMDRILSEMNELRKEMLRLPELCAQRMIEKLNKTGVSYKPSNLEEDEENLYGGINESSNDVGRPQKEFVYQKDDSDRFRTPSKMNLQKDDNGVDVTSRENTPFYCTSEYWDSFKGDMDDPVQVPEVSDEKAATSLETDEIASHAPVGSQGVQEEVEEVTGRRKRRGSQHVKSPYVVPKPNKRAKRSAKGKLFQNGDVNKSGDEYDVVKASIKYVRAHEHLQKHAKTEIFNDGMEEGLTVRRACQIINHEWLSGDVIDAYSSFLVDKVNDDCFMLTTWRIHWLLHVRPGKKTAGNDYEAESHSNGPVNRCEDEYFKKLKTYIPLNKQNNHWITVVMHSGKREFQVLDSLMTGKLDTVTRELVEDLRKQLAEDIQEANATGIVNYPDVSKWPIQTYDMPKQHDGNSCGLFLLRCFQNWDGDKWTGLFSQTSIDDSRELMIAQLIFSERNKLDEVKNKVIRISKKKK